VYYVDLAMSAAPLPPPAPAGWLTRLFRHIMFNLRSLPYIVGVRAACDGFRNMDEALGRAEIAAPPASMALGRGKTPDGAEAEKPPKT
jgi:hypothetical protein